MGIPYFFNVLIEMANKDYYDILGLKRNATDSEIRKAYKRGAVAYHPDKQQGKTEKEKKEAEEKFKDINEAYQILSDPEKKRMYDTYGTVDGNGGMSAESAMNEFMKHMRMGGFGDFFGSGSDTNYVRKGRDIRINVNIPLGELLRGGKHNIKYSRYVKCSHCGGTGSENGKTEKCPHCNGTGTITKIVRNGFAIIQNMTTCPYCKGTGTIITSPCKKCDGMGLERVNETMDFEIPYGITNGAYMTIEGMGNEVKDGVNGDATLVFTIGCPDGFSISSSDPFDINVNLKVPILDCMTGGKYTLKHADGRTLAFDIPECANDGHVLRIRNEGLRMGNGSKGRLNVIIRHGMPKKLSKSDMKSVEKLKELNSFK